MDKEEKDKLLNLLYGLKLYGYKYIKPIDFNKLQNNIALPDNYTQLEDMINNCNLCRLSNQAKDKIVSNGDISSKIIFISVYDFRYNSALNKLFNDMLVNVLEISPDDILHLDIVKCNISDNIKIEDDDISNCKQYIIKQLDILQPRLIITLGDSYRYLLNDDTKLNLLHGTIHKYKNIDLVPIYDIDTLYRNPSLKKETMEDLLKIKYMMGEI